jgi:hypothetical protein
MVRDWNLTVTDIVFAPYSDSGLMPEFEMATAMRWLWPMRTTLGGRITFGRTTYAEEGRPWWGWHQVTVDRIRYQYVLAFGEIATHNHFVLDRGGKVFNQTAPVIKLPAGASEERAPGAARAAQLVGGVLLVKQVCHNKGSTVDQHGSTADDRRSRTSTHNSTKVAEFPLVELPVIDIATR